MAVVDLLSNKSFERAGLARRASLRSVNVLVARRSTQNR